MLLNLTPNPVVLIAESGEKTEIPASGYVARVETTRRIVGRAPIGGQRVAKAIGAPIIEETPGEIVFTCTEDKDGNIPSDFIAEVAAKNKGLFLVSREVAEAAQFQHRGPVRGAHPLASRMVWACDPIFCETHNCYHENPSEWGSCIIGYLALQRVPQQ